MIVTAIKFLVGACILAANAYYLLSIIAGYRFFSQRESDEDDVLEPATILIPLHGADFKAYDNYSELCR